VAIYLLILALASLALTLVGAALVALGRAVRRVIVLGEAHFDVSPRTLRPGEVVTARARVLPRGDRKARVVVTLRCTMFDHRARDLFVRSVPMSVASDDPHAYTAEIALPDHALRTGVAGDDLSSLFSEDARRLLVFWSVHFEVKPADGETIWLHATRPIEVPEGRPLRTDSAYIGQLVIDTFASIKDDMLFNWLVKVAARDGEISSSEREFLREVLASAHGIRDAAEADARIESEQKRDVDIDPALIRKHIPPDARVNFYKLLYAVAWRDGSLDKREHAFLVDTLQRFGLDRTEVDEVEREVLRGIAQNSLR
jgi:uncharacterized tellurite resistance protein B-like protein